jgi:hypothetical protein
MTRPQEYLYLTWVERRQDPRHGPAVPTLVGEPLATFFATDPSSPYPHGIRQENPAPTSLG